ncbi:MAG: membrane-bound serine protease (ClpP class) [Verrucomicrobiales bacterium]|jgi:membrane-bound serine protease (ClpP class)
MTWLVFGFLFIGLLLLWAEFYLPGGLLGLLACGFLIAGIVLGFVEFGGLIGSLLSLVVVAFVGTMVYFWMKTFHTSFFGKRMMLNASVGGEEVYEQLAELVGRVGETTTKLHPSGKAIVDDQKIDAVAERGVIDVGVKIKVVRVDGINIVVRPATA